MPMTWSAFGGAMRTLRRARGLSLAELSVLVHYSKGYLSKIETGVRSPSPELARCCDDVLQADGQLSALLTADARPLGRHLPAGHPPGRPAQLPADVPGFTGRADALARLTAAAGAAWPGTELAGQASQSGCMLIVGPPGVGKTALALHWAHRVAHQFPDGCLYADLRGYQPTGVHPAAPEQVLAGFLRALGAPAPLPEDPDELGAMFRTMVTGSRLLIVLDNAENSAQVRPLLPGASSSVAVITSRGCLSGLTALDAPTRITLSPLPADDATELISRVVGKPRAQAEPAAVASLARLCGYLPLALRIAAERAARHPRRTIEDLAGQLATDQDRLDLLAAADDDAIAIRSAFSWSYRTLPKAAARMFRLISLHAGPDISLQAAAALAAVPVGHARRQLDLLTAAHLLEESGRHRYTCHDLLSLYAAELSRTEDSEPDRACAIRRLLAWYLSQAAGASVILRPAPSQIPALEPPRPAAEDIVPAEFLGYDHALDWLESERANLIAAVRLGARAGEHEYTWRLPVALWRFFDIKNLWSEWTEINELGLAAARAAGDRAGEALIVNNLGLASFEAGSSDQAIDYFGQALGIRCDIGDLGGQAAVLSNLGLVSYQDGRFGEAKDYFLRAMRIGQQIGDARHEHIARNNLGETCCQLGLVTEAVDHLERALGYFRASGDQHGAGNALDNLGEAHRRLGNLKTSLACLTEALRILEKIGDQRGCADVLVRLGDLHADADRCALARKAWLDASASYARLGHPAPPELHARLTGHHHSTRTGSRTSVTM